MSVLRWKNNGGFAQLPGVAQTETRPSAMFVQGNVVLVKLKAQSALDVADGYMHLYEGMMQAIPARARPVDSFAIPGGGGMVSADYGDPAFSGGRHFQSGFTIAMAGDLHDIGSGSSTITDDGDIWIDVGWIDFERICR
jgi:hypothetical protein